MNILNGEEKQEMLVAGIFINADSTGLENTKKLKGVSIVAIRKMQLLYSSIILTDN